MEVRLKRERMYLWLIHVVVWQKTTQHCKAITLQLKKVRIKKELLIFLSLHRDLQLGEIK